MIRGNFVPFVHPHYHSVEEISENGDVELVVKEMTLEELRSRVNLNASDSFEQTRVSPTNTNDKFDVIDSLRNDVDKLNNLND